MKIALSVVLLIACSFGQSVGGRPGSVGSSTNNTLSGSNTFNGSSTFNGSTTFTGSSTFSANLLTKYFDASTNTLGGTRIVSRYPGTNLSVQLQNCINDIANTAFVGNGGTCDATDFGDSIWTQNVTISTNGIHVKLPCNRMPLQDFGFIITGNGTWIEGCSPYGTNNAGNSQISTQLLPSYNTNTGPTGNGGSCVFCIGTSSTNIFDIRITDLSINSAAGDSGLQPPAAPGVSCSNSGGSLATNTIFVKVSLEIPAGPTANTNGTSAASSESSCAVTGPSGSVTVTVPTTLSINPFACWTVGSSSTTGTELKNSTGTCITAGTYVIQSLGAGASMPTTGNAFDMPIYAYRLNNSVFERINIGTKTATNNSGSVAFQVDAANGVEAAWNTFKDIFLSAALVGFRCQGGTGFCAANNLYGVENSGPLKTVVGSIGFDFQKGDANCLGCADDNTETGLNLTGNGGTYVYRAEPSTTTNHVRFNSGTQTNTVILTTAGDTVVNNSGNNSNVIIQPDAGETVLSVTGGTYKTFTNCAVNSASPAACGSAASGVFVVPTLTTSYTVNTTAVTSNSRIFLQAISDNTGIPSAPTCAALAVTAVSMVSGRSAGTSFTFTLPSTTGTTCFEYWIVN